MAALASVVIALMALFMGACADSLPATGNLGDTDGDAHLGDIPGLVEDPSELADFMKPRQVLKVTPPAATGWPTFIVPFHAEASDWTIIHPGASWNHGRIRHGGRGVVAEIAFNPIHDEALPAGVQRAVVRTRSDESGSWRVRLLDRVYYGMVVKPLDVGDQADIPPWVRPAPFLAEGGAMADVDLDRVYAQVQGRVENDWAERTPGLVVQAFDTARGQRSSKGVIKRAGRAFEFELPEGDGLFDVEIAGRVDALPFFPTLRLPGAVRVNSGRIALPLGTTPEGSLPFPVASVPVGICRIHDGWVRFRDKDGVKPLPEAAVTFEAQLSEGRFTKTITTGSEGAGGTWAPGAFTIDLLPAFYRVSIFPPPEVGAASDATPTFDCRPEALKSRDGTYKDPRHGLDVFEFALAEFVVSPRPELTILLRTQDNRPVAGATLRLLKQAGTDRTPVYSVQGVSDDSGEWRVAVDPGEWRLSADPSADSGLARVDEYAIRLSTAARFTVTLPPGLAVAGRILDGDGQRMGSARVEVFDEWRAPGADTTMTRLRATATANAEGRFVLRLPRD